MKRMLRTVIGACLLAGTALPAAHAADKMTAKDEALRFLRASGYGEGYDAAAMRLVDAESLVRDDADLQKDHTELLIYVKEQIAWAKVEDKVAEALAKQFSAGELAELQRFAETPVGRKLLQRQVELLLTAIRAGERNVMAGRAELEKRLALRADLDERAKQKGVKK